MGEFVVAGDDGALAVRIKLGSASTSEYLQHIQHTNVNKRSLLGIIDLRTLIAERDRGIERVRDRGTETETETGTERGGERDRQTDRERERERERERDVKS